MGNNAFVDDLLKRLNAEFLSIEKNQAYTDDEKVQRLIFTTAAICAGIAVQPIPFADMPILTTIEGFMGWKIAQIRGVPLGRDGAIEVVKYLGGVIGLGFMAQQTIIGLYKTFIPFLGGITTIPLVFSAVFAIGRAMDVYFCAKKQGRLPTREEILRAFKSGKEQGKSAGRSEAARRKAAGQIS